MKFRIILFAAAAMVGGAVPALAEQVAIQRNVTVRETPNRRSDPLNFPAIGSRLELLDDGSRRAGYYHVRLPDGREGWVYFTFVRRLPDEPDESLTAASADRAAIHYIDVDQGAAALLEFSCGAILIDAGGRGTAAGNHLMAYLAAFFQRRPDLNNRLAAVFLTHAHQDHNLYLRRIAQTFQIGAFIYNGKLDRRTQWMVDRGNAPATAFTVVAVAESQIQASGTQGVTNSNIDPVDCAGTDPGIRVLSGGRSANPGWTSGEFRQPNNHSLVIRVDFGEASFLFTGDLETPGIDALVRRYSGTTRLDVDVYEVGHHGAENGTTAAMLDAMTPEVAIISVGNPDTQGVPMSAHDHGHPRKLTLQLLASSISRPRASAVDIRVAERGTNALFEPFRVNDAIYATTLDGDLIIGANANGVLAVRTGK